MKTSFVYLLCDASSNLYKIGVSRKDPHKRIAQLQTGNGNDIHLVSFHNTKYPFAILCDRENKYTKDFDQVVLLDNVKNNYHDKFRMLIDSPYQ